MTKKLSSLFLGLINNSKKIDNITIKIGSENIILQSMLGILAFLWTGSARILSTLTTFHLHCIINLGTFVILEENLDFNTAKTVVQALILSKLDYCNSLLAGTSECQLSWLQRVQNMACRVVCNLRKYDHVSASIYSLHWLKVRERITYKIAYLVYCCKMRLAPQYLIDVLPTVIHNRSLRSLIGGNLPSAKCWTSLASEGSCSAVGPKIWNSYHLEFSSRGQAMVLERV